MPPFPVALPRISVSDVYDALEEWHGEGPGRLVAEALLERERLIVDSLMEHRALLVPMCEAVL